MPERGTRFWWLIAINVIAVALAFLVRVPWVVIAWLALAIWLALVMLRQYHAMEARPPWSMVSGVWLAWMNVIAAAGWLCFMYALLGAAQE
jgi:hypothetical protein